MMQDNETFAERVERLRPERENQPEACDHCGFETKALTNYSRDWGGYVGGHWLCELCRHTLSASRQGSGGPRDETVRDVAMMLNLLAEGLFG